MSNTQIPNEEVTASEIDHTGEGEHDTDFTETASKGGTTTRERNASNKKTQVIALIFGALIIIMVMAFAYLKFFNHPKQNVVVHPTPNVALNNDIVHKTEPVTEAPKPAESNPMAVASTTPSLPLPEATTNPASAINGEIALPAPQQTPTPIAVTEPAHASSSHSLPAEQASAPAVPSSSPVTPATEQSAQDKAMAALLAGSAPASASSTTPAPAVATSAKLLPTVPEIKSAPTISLTENTPASSSSAEATADASQEVKSEGSESATPNSEALTLLNQISDQVHGIKEKVDSQDVEIQTLKDRLSALENKVASTPVKKEVRHVTHTQKSASSKNSVSLVDSKNSVEVVQPKPVVHKRPTVAKIEKAEPKTDDTSPKTVTGTSIPGGVCAGLSRGRVWVKKADGSFKTLGVGDDIGGKVISNVSLSDGVTAGNITYTCR